MLFTVSIIGLVALAVLLTYYYRHRIHSVLVRFFPSLQAYVPLSTWDDQRNAGMSSSMFDIEAANIEAGDSRSGLDERGAEEVRRIMLREGVSFDEARLIRHKLQLSRNGIDATGMPTDPKAITRL